MKNRSVQIAIALLALLSMVGATFSCRSNKKSVGFTKANGKPCEVTLVMDGAYMDDSVGYALKEVLQQPAPSLPQIEPSLDVALVPKDNFQSFLRNASSIIIVSIDNSRFTKTTLKYTYDEWSEQQIVVTLNAPTVDALLRYAKDNARLIINLFLRNDLYRIAAEREDDFSLQVNDTLTRLFNYQLNVPKSISSFNCQDNFVWMSNNQIRRRMDFVVYQVPNNQQKVDKSYMIALRDSVMAAHLPGGTEGSHAITAKYGHEYRQLLLADGSSLYELRGLWEMTGGEMMGGPFVMQARWTADAQHLIIAEGFIYHPNQRKRNLILNAEASLYTLRPTSTDIYDSKQVRQVKWSTAE